MRICGVEMRASEAILVFLEGDASTYVVIDSAVKKIALQNDASQESVKSFFTSVAGFVRDYGVNEVVIKQRNKKGEFAGGPVAFKMEALFQMLDCPVYLLSPVAISAHARKSPVALPKNVNKYQEAAFNTARAFLAKK